MSAAYPELCQSYHVRSDLTAFVSKLPFLGLCHTFWGDKPAAPAEPSGPAMFCRPSEVSGSEISGDFELVCLHHLHFVITTT